MIRVMFAGGKTGGHILPAIAMAIEFEKRFPRSQIVFVGTQEGLESTIVPGHGFQLLLIQARGISRRSYLSNLSLLFYLPRGLCQAFRIISSKRPHLVVGTGGYVSFPVVLLASVMNVPVMIQEQNSYPGISTRVLSHFADRVCLSYPESRMYFPPGRKFTVIGNPVRPDLPCPQRREALKVFGLEEGRKTVFVFGGSQGARAINRALLECLDCLKPDWQILWQTGERDFAEISGMVRDREIACKVYPFIEDMASAYACSDLVVSRAGALTLAEITACGKPAILIPFPFAAADHQRHNARALERAGAASVILEKDLTPEKLSGAVLSLLSDDARLRQMAEKSSSLGRPDATPRLVDEMERLLSEKTKADPRRIAAEAASRA